MTGFKKRIVTPDRVAQVEAAAASSPIIGDPRMPSHEPNYAPPIPFQVTTPARAHYLVGQTYDVPLGKIKSNPLNPRFVYNNAAIDQMATSLSRMGQITPATGFVEESGEVVLIEGETRLRGCRAGSQNSNQGASCQRRRPLRRGSRS